MNSDGSAPLQLTADPALDDSPAWSPDGKRIAFHSQRSLGPGPFASGDKIWVMDADGSNPERAAASAFNDSYPAWEPDGSRIAFTTTRAGNLDIFQQDLAGAMAPLIDSGFPDTYPDWSPDGRRLAFSSRRTGNFDVYTTAATYGSGPTQLTTAAGYDVFPAWSPDGRQIVFMSTRDGDEEIYTMNADGSGQTRRTERAGPDAAPDWQPLTASGVPGPGDVPGPGGTTGPPRPEAPVLSRLTVAPKRLSRRARGGLRFRYQLSEPAVVRFSLHRRSERRGRARYLKVGGFSQQGIAGPNGKGFSGRLRGRRLRVGRYEARAVATDPVGSRSTTKRVRFLVVR
jgi:dipeptidyl aminopeptidase/acylaminoacyl peptidase